MTSLALAADIVPAREFLTRLFSGYPEGEGLTCEVRCLGLETEGETGDSDAVSPPNNYYDSTYIYRGNHNNYSAPKSDRNDNVTRKWFGLKKVDFAASSACDLSDSHNVYCGVLPRSGRGGFANDVFFANWLWCDLDAGNSSEADVFAMLQRIYQSLPTPAMLVFSGSGGVHLYWRLEKTVALDSAASRRQFTNTLRRLAREVGGQAPGVHADIAAAEVARVLRIPGTFNHKWRPAREVILMVVKSPSVMPMEWFEAHLPLEPCSQAQEASRSRLTGKETSYPAAGGGWNGWIPEKALQWAMTPTAEGGRNQDMCSWAAFLRRELHLPTEVIRDLLERKRNINPGSRMSDREIDSIARWAGLSA